MLRTTITMTFAGALLALAGCESTGVQGTTSYRGDDVYGDRTYRQEVAGDTRYHGTVAGDRSYSGSTATIRDNDSGAVDARPAAAKTETTRTETVVVDEPKSRAHEPAAADAAAVAAAAGTNVRSLHYPSELKATNDLPATAVVDPSYNSLKIANATDRDLRNVTIWIDGKYGAQVGQVPPKGTIAIQRGDFVDRDGHAPADLKNPGQIQLQTHDDLYNLQGPVFDNR